MYYLAFLVVAKDLHSTTTLIYLTVSSYMIVSGIAPSIVGEASDTFGRRLLYIITLIIYLIANIGIALQNSFVVLLLLRMLQSAGISGQLPWP